MTPGAGVSAPDVLFELIEADLAPPGRVDPVLRGVTLQLRRGEIAVLCGANGSGKTTLLRTAAGLWPLRAGAMRPPAPAGFDPRRAALLLEDPGAQFTAGTVAGEIEFALENLSFSLEDIRRRRDEVLEGLGVSRLAAADPGKLSPGEQEMALVAAALATRPPILLLDDPFLYLGPGEAGRIWEWLVDSVRKDRTAAILLATHDPEPSLDADHLGLLDDGRLAAWGPPGEIWRGPTPPGVERPAPEARDGESPGSRAS